MKLYDAIGLKVVRFLCVEVAVVHFAQSLTNLQVEQKIIARRGVLINYLQPNMNL